MILRVCVVVPTYNNARTLSEVIKDIVISTPFPVLVIDDGSETPAVNVLYSWEVRNALETGRVKVLRFEDNRGKGAALQLAVGELASQGFTHMLTMDADGQHFAREIRKLVEIAVDHPWDLIIGDRKLKSPSEKMNRFSRAFSNFWVNYQTGLHIKDSQSGFRLYPLLPIQTMRFFTRRYDFEIEVLIRLVWNGVHVHEADIDVHYPKSKERVNFMQRMWNSARISSLNTLLVMVSLLKTHRSPRELSMALGLGVFIGCTPFMGMHSVILIPFALALRLNAIIMWLGTHVSTPILIPFVLMSELWIAEHWLHMPIEGGFKDEFYRALAGSMVLGMILGVSTLIISFVIAYSLKKRAPHTNWKGPQRGGRLGNGLLNLMLRHGGAKYSYALLPVAALYFYIFAPKARRGLDEYWKMIAPKETWCERQTLVLRQLVRFGEILIDLKVQNFSTEVPKQGKILLGAHLGSAQSAFALAESNIFSDQLGEIHSALKNGRCVGLMGDRPVGDRFELIPFLGRLAPFDMTAFRLSAVYKVPLIFTFGFKNKKGDYEVFTRRPAKVYQFTEQQAREIQCYNWAREYVRELEHFVRVYPEQWFNFYPFWSDLPVTPSGQLAAQSHNYLLEDLKSTAE